MLDKLKKLTPKDWLYIAGALASLIALYYLFGRGGASTGNGTITDTPNTDTLPLSSSPGYTTYNVGPVNPIPLSTPPDETPAGSCGCGSPSSMGCAGPSQLDNGSAYSSNNQLYAFLDSISPQYAQLQAQQLQTYNQYFAEGSEYSTGAGVVQGVSGA